MSAKANPVIWFEIPVKDLERAKKFYEAVLDLPLSPPSEVNGMSLCFFPMEKDVVGAGGALIKNSNTTPSTQGIAIYFRTDGIEPILQRITKSGGTVAVPRTSIGQFGFMAHFVDTEGNRVGLHEMVAGPCNA